MIQRFCPHLEEYGVQFTKTAASYEAFNAHMDRFIEEGRPPELVEVLNQTLEEWRKENRTLRAMFLELYENGRILLPKGALRQARRHDHQVHGKAKCSDCFREVPRLVFGEWQLAHNGMVNFRGRELPQGTGAGV
ncbi:MAG: hypothetical protein AB7V45_04655 [Candidatus Krumholzibacteriia bacterium]